MKKALQMTAHGKVVEFEGTIKSFYIFKDGKGMALNCADGTHWFTLLIFREAFAKLFHGEWTADNGDAYIEDTSIGGLNKSGDLTRYIENEIVKFSPASKLRISCKGIYKHISKANPCQRTGKAPKKAGQVWREIIVNFPETLHLEVLTTTRHNDMLSDMMTPPVQKDGYGDKDNKHHADPSRATA